MDATIPPDVAESFRAYPAIPHAIIAVEIVMCGRGKHATHRPGESNWDNLMSVATERGKSPADVVRAIKKGLPVITDYADTPKALVEMDHPQFLTYVAGKMGAV